jgi:hypothetical protein
MLTDQWVTREFPTQRAGPFSAPSQKETAALAGPRSGGEWKIEAFGEPLAAQCRTCGLPSSWIPLSEALERVLTLMEVAHAR